MGNFTGHVIAEGRGEIVGRIEFCRYFAERDIASIARDDTWAEGGKANSETKKQPRGYGKGICMTYLSTGDNEERKNRTHRGLPLHSVRGSSSGYPLSVGGYTLARCRLRLADP